MKLFVLGTRGFPNIQGGVEKHCEHLYPLLANQFKVSVFRRNSYLQKSNDSAYPTIHFIDLPSTKIKGFEAFFHSFLCTIYCIIKRPAIVHIHNIGPGMFSPLLKLFGIRTVLTYHSPNYEHDKWNFLAKLILKAGEKLAVNTVDSIIFINTTQMLKFNKKIIDKSVFIPNGIEVQPRLTTTQYIQSIGLQPYKYILAVGRITQEKGFDYLIDAYNLLHKKDIKLVIAGGMDHKSDYAKQIMKKTSNQIIFTGFVEGKRLQELYSFARLFVLPSHNEGYPLVLIEAASYNLPILASNISANLQLKLPEERYFEVGSVNSLKSKIESELEKEEQTVIYDIKLHEWKEIANQVSTLYSKICIQ